MTIDDMKRRIVEYCSGTDCERCKLFYMNRHDVDEMSEQEVKQAYCMVFGDSGVAAPDQTAKADAGKPKLSLVPTQIIYDIAAVREYGCNKYPEGGKDNWKQVELQRFRDAAYRHFLAYINDPDGVDKESGLPHRWHLECNLAFLAELEGSNGKA